ncbi:MAG: anthranilate phosphoribosyltransferase [Acidobacteria bacterium]|nr:anthranilate phosphoribosyltransferase [Acidobacteriota bacterium]
MSLLPYLNRVVSREPLSAGDAEAAMHIILSGEATHAQIASFLTALKMKGETSDELVGFARAMRRMAAPIAHGLGGEALLDTCGTGGDGANTFNISTVAAFVVAGAGVHVAKHGNRSISSKCGSADLLEAWGADIAMPPERAARAIREIGIGFLFAPAVHSAMKHAQPVRTELKMRTAFNLLGPLTNPAGANAQLAGAPSLEAAELIAHALAALGLNRGFVVHGSDGLDEITTTGPTTVWEIRDGRAEKRILEPADFGLRTARPEDLRGGDARRNREIADGVLAGAPGPARDIVMANAAAALVAAGKAETFLEGMALAVVAIETGAAKRKVADLAGFR